MLGGRWTSYKSVMLRALSSEDTFDQTSRSPDFWNFKGYHWAKENKVLPAKNKQEVSVNIAYVMSYYIVLYYTILIYYIVLYHIMLYYIILYYIHAHRFPTYFCRKNFAVFNLWWLLKFQKLVLSLKRLRLICKLKHEASPVYYYFISNWAMVINLKMSEIRNFLV